jgi:hypothetical protein
MKRETTAALTKRWCSVDFYRSVRIDSYPLARRSAQFGACGIARKREKKCCRHRVERVRDDA